MLPSDTNNLGVSCVTFYRPQVSCRLPSQLANKPLYAPSRNQGCLDIRVASGYSRRDVVEFSCSLLPLTLLKYHRVHMPFSLMTLPDDCVSPLLQFQLPKRGATAYALTDIFVRMFCMRTFKGSLTQIKKRAPDVTHAS